jgi:quercetin dioxygenase-like cupin family protein
MIGTNDLTADMGLAGQYDHPRVREAYQRTIDICRRHGKHCGVVTTGPADLAMRRDQGFQLTALGLDGGLLLRTLTESLAQAGVSRQVVPTFVPENKPGAAVVPAKTRPDKYKPDRREMINVVAEASTVEIAPGVNFRPLVGKHNSARDFTTGIVTFDPGAELPYHLHTFTESITLLQGRAALEVEGRRYALQQLDNAVLPPGTAHFVSNTSRTVPAVFHISMATETPSRELVKRFFSSKTMPPDSKGQPGAERVNVHAIADWYEPNPGARFVDFMNRDLGFPDMSGGYGIFKPGAQLPCHIHDFDESITIIQGNATCIVEGRRYSMKDNATALVPRGRCHYFINETNEPMAMVWVYAGPMPERMVMEATMCDIGFGE